MRLLGLSIAALALTFPATGNAQNTTLIDMTPPRPRPRATQMNDLVGSWAREGEKEVRYTFFVDSTANVFVQTNVDNGERGPKTRVYDRVDSVQAEPAEPSK